MFPFYVLKTHLKRGYVPLFLTTHSTSNYFLCFFFLFNFFICFFIHKKTSFYMNFILMQKLILLQNRNLCINYFLISIEGLLEIVNFLMLLLMLYIRHISFCNYILSISLLTFVYIVLVLQIVYYYLKFHLMVFL